MDFKSVDKCVYRMIMSKLVQVSVLLCQIRTCVRENACTVWSERRLVYRVYGSAQTLPRKCLYAKRTASAYVKVHAKKNCRGLGPPSNVGSFGKNGCRGPRPTVQRREALEHPRVRGVLLEERAGPVDRSGGNPGQLGRLTGVGGRAARFRRPLGCCRTTRGLGL